MTLIDFRSIQGNTLRGYGVKHALGHHLLARITDPVRARRTIAALVPQVTADEWGDDTPHTTLNLAFTYSGLVRLGLSRDITQRFSDEFRQGMRDRAQQLGDDPEFTGWEAHWADGVDLLVAANAPNARALEHHVVRLRTSLVDGGCEIVYEQPTAFPFEGLQFVPREHFGYVDGRGQPTVEGVPVAAHKHADRLGVPEGDGWRAVKPGEFVFGYEKEGGSSSTPGDRPPAARAGSTPDDTGHIAEFERFHEFMRNGSYLVYRKLRQRVGAFRLFVRHQRENLDEELFAAKLVGRWRDSTPLMLANTEEDWRANWKDQHKSLAVLNEFGYASDSRGYIVPQGAHARRANPRDSLAGDTNHAAQVRRRRIIRRGVPYGPPHVPWDASDERLRNLDEAEEERGLIFLSIQTNIAGQFELVQRDWLNDGDIYDQGSDRCPVVGHQVAGPESKMIMIGHTPPLLAGIPSFVELRGGDLGVTV